VCGRINPHTDFSQTRPPSVPHEWVGDEARSLKLSFDPAGYAELKKEAPSIEIGRSGDVYYRNDRHQKRVFREIAATQRRYAEEEQARLDRRKATREDIAEAVQAVGKFRESQNTRAGSSRAQRPSTKTTVPLRSRTGATP
jgi:hypothetical protein